MDAAALNIHGQTCPDDPSGVRHKARASTKTLHCKSNPRFPAAVVNLIRMALPLEPPLCPTRLIIKVLVKIVKRIESVMGGFSAPCSFTLA
jgi:hypothetical protein